MNNLSANDQANSNGTSDYKPMLIGVNMNTDISFIDITLGAGLSMASGDVDSNQDYSMTTFYLSSGIGYSLKFENYGKNKSLNLLDVIFLS